MNKKGFTLIELLAVIVLLAIIVMIAVPSIIGINKALKNEMLNKKITMLEEAAELYGQDNSESISETKKYNDFPCFEIKAGVLVPDYVDSDSGSTAECGTSSSNCIKNPKDESQYLDNLDIIIYLRNRRVKAVAKYGNHSSDICR